MLLKPSTDSFERRTPQDISLTGQNFAGGKASGNVTVKTAVPLSEKYREKAIKKFAHNPDADVRYSLPDVDKYTEKQYNYDTHYGENLHDTFDDMKPTTDREWQAFCRSFANQTNGLQNNVSKSIAIITAESLYFISADGYMSGVVYDKIPIDEYKERLEEYDNISRTTVSNFGNEEKEYRQGNYSDDNSLFENTGRDSFDVELADFVERYSKSRGYTVKSRDDIRNEKKEQWKKLSNEFKINKKIKDAQSADSLDGSAYSLPESRGQLSVPDIAVGKSNEELSKMVSRGEITIDEALTEARNEYGTMPKGENPKATLMLYNE